MKYEIAEVPFKTVGNRRCLTMEQIVDDPALADFVSRFENSFEFDPGTCVAWFIEPESKVVDFKKRARG